jgi:hypothetical protein
VLFKSKKQSITMFNSILIAGLAATFAYGSPLASSAPYSSYTPAKTTMMTSYGNPTATPNPAIPSGLVASLLTSDSEVDRFKLLAAQDPTHQVFDFNPAANPGTKPGMGGQVDLANRANFPILSGLGLSAATLFFNPCGLNTPHIHPRASEFFTVATPGRIETGFVLENGLITEFNTTLTQFQGTVFPQGSIHFQQNLECTPQVGISGLNSEDPGASSIAQNFFALDPAVIDATLGFPKQIDASNFAQFKKSIPMPFVQGIESCFQRCNIKY